MLHTPISILTSVPTLVVTLLLTPFIIRITNIKNILNYVTSSIDTLISTLIDAYNIILMNYEFMNHSPTIYSHKCNTNINIRNNYLIFFIKINTRNSQFFCSFFRKQSSQLKM